MKILSHLSKIIFIICVPLVLTGSIIACEIVSSLPYRYCFDKYEISEVTGIPRTQLDEVANELIRFFKSDAQDLDITVSRDGESFSIFNEGEVIHFRDVRTLVQLTRNIALVTLVYMLLYLALGLLRRGRRYLAVIGQLLYYGGALTILLIVLLGAGMLINFDWLFWQFHQLSFSNEYWMSSGYMPVIFPAAFWNDVAILTTAVIGVGALLLGGLGYWLQQHFGK